MASLKSKHRRSIHLSSTIPDLTDKITRVDSQYCAAGGFGDVYRCRYTSDNGAKEVAVKAFRFGFSVDESKDGGKSARMIHRELGIWRRLSHPNIVPFLGVAYGFGLQGNVSLVSKWMPHGTLHTFLKAHDDRLVIAHRLQLLLDIANGLDYLHSFPVVHGDLTSSNVLVDHSYNARLADFGCASLVGELPEGLTYLKMTNVRPGNLRWAAPEQLDEQETKHTTKSDIYSLGHIALLVLSGKYPWSEIQFDAVVVLRLSRGLKPGRPLHQPIDDKHWTLIEQCWSSVPERPLAKDVVSSLEQFLRAVQVSGTIRLAAALSQNRSVTGGNTIDVGSAVQNGSADAGPSTQSQPPNAPTALNERERPNASTTDGHKVAIPDSQVLTQFWHPTMTPEVAAQMQKLIEKKGIRLQNFGSASHTPGTTPNETGINPASATNNQVASVAWSGTFNGTFPNQAMNDVQIHVVGTFNPSNPTDIRTEIRTDLWPKGFTLNPLKVPLKDMSEFSSWFKRHQSRARIMQFKSDPRAPDRPLNVQKFIALNKFMTGHHIFTYAGWQLPSGKFSYNILILPMGAVFVGIVFSDGLPDLPGNGNVLEISPPVAEAKPPQMLSGLTFPPALMAHMQGLEPAKQKELLGHFIRLQRQERLRRQQLQQTQQAHPASGQVNSLGLTFPPALMAHMQGLEPAKQKELLEQCILLLQRQLRLQQTQQAHPASGQVNSLGMSIPPNPMGTVTSISPGLHANVGAHNAGGGTSVNFEMMQSFMQRNADGSTPQTQGMSSG